MANTITLPKLQYPATRARGNVDVKALLVSIAGMIALAAVRRDREISQVPKAWKVTRRTRNKEVADGVPFDQRDYDYPEGLKDDIEAYLNDVVFGSRRDPGHGGSGSIPFSRGREAPVRWWEKWIEEEKFWYDKEGKLQWQEAFIKNIPPRTQSTVERKNPRRNDQEAAEPSTLVEKDKRRRASLKSGVQMAKKQRTPVVTGKDSLGNTVNIKKNRGLSQRQKVVVHPSNRQLRARPSPPSERQLRAQARSSYHRSEKTINDKGEDLEGEQKGNASESESSGSEDT